MPIAGPSYVCRAPNAFNVRAYVSSIFPHPRSTSRWLSATSSRPQDVAQHIRQEKDTTQEALMDGQDLAENSSSNSLKLNRSSKSFKIHERRLQESLDPSSLKKTLEKHRATNKDFLNRRLKTQDAYFAGPIASQQPRQLNREREAERIGSTQSEIDDLLENPNNIWFKHLNLTEHRYGDKASRIVATKKSKYRTQVLEYDGQYVAPPDAAKKGNLKLPWIVQSPMPADERLDSEIRGFWEYSKLTQAEQAAHNAVFQQTQELVQQLYPNYKIESFGSRSTGLVMVNSDLDLRLYRDDVSADTDTKMAPPWVYKSQVVKTLSSLHSKLDAHPDYILCLLRQSRYPLISMQHKESGITIQIVGCNDNSYQRTFVQRYLDEYEGLAALFAVVKTMLEIRGLLDVYRGGIGSYSLFMMIVASLKLWGQRIDFDGNYNPLQATKLYGSVHESSIGAKLCHFLHFYSGFTTYKNMITVEPPKVHRKVHVDEKIPKKELEKMEKYPEVRGRYAISVLDPSQQYLLCLQDPADPTNDLGQKIYAYKHLRATVKFLHRKLVTDLGASDQRFLLDSILGPSFALYEGRRSKMEGYGSKFL